MTPSTHNDVYVRLITLLPVAFVSLILPLLARGRRGILFGVTVPLDFSTGPIACRATRRFRVSVSRLAVIVLASLLFILQFVPSDSAILVVATIVAVPLQLLIAFLFWRRESIFIKPYAATIPLERHADLAPPSATPALIAIALAALPLAAVAQVLRSHWSRIPARWADHFDLHGNPNGWAARTFAGVYAPVLFGMLLMAVFFAVGLFMARASGPQTSQRRRALTPMAGIAWLVSGMLSLIATLPLTHLDSTHFVLITIVYLIAVFAVAFWFTWRSGLSPQSQADSPYDSTPDSGWHGGLIYYNPGDASVLVPRRFGFGWTLNFARTAAWLYLAGIFLVIGAILVLTVFLK